MSEELYVNGDQMNWAQLPSHIVLGDQFDTLPKLLLHNGKNFPDEVAQREKDFGIWNAVTWQQFSTHVANMSVAFDSFGVKPGEAIPVVMTKSFGPEVKVLVPSDIPSYLLGPQ